MLNNDKICGIFYFIRVVLVYIGVNLSKDKDKL